MSKHAEITVILAVAAGVANLLWVRGITSNKPVGQRGLYGTGLADSQLLRWVQIIFLVLFEIASLVGIYFLWKI